jgi:hypothetical protein
VASVIDGPRSLAIRLFGVAVAAVLLVAVLAGTADAASPVKVFSVTPSSTQAGGHPDLKIKIEVGNRATQGFANPCFCSDPKEIVVNMPAGVIGNPHVTPKCTAAQFGAKECPLDSQVGLTAVLLFDRPGNPGAGGFIIAPVYNMVPPPGTAGLLEFPESLLGSPQYIELKARTGGDFGLTSITTGLERLAPVAEILQYLWGVPASPFHDIYRGFSSICQVGEVEPYLDANVDPAPACNGGTATPRSSSSPLLPFLSNPTACTGALTASVFTASFDLENDFAETGFPAMEGCDQLGFNPSLSAIPTTRDTDSASGLDANLSVPQFQSPSVPSPSQIKQVKLTLPEGFSINANAADGKTVCGDVEASFGTEDPAHCPEFSKIGTTVLESSALPGPISGYLYLGESKPGDRYRVILTADGFATHIKLPGSIFADPVTGQLTMTFANLPQSPLTRFGLHVFGSERGVLATPTQCGTYAVKSTFTPWASPLPEQTSTQFFSLDSGPNGTPCPGKPRPLDASLKASSAHSTGGAYSPFGLEFTRNDGGQNLTGVSVKTPPGFSAALKGVSYCPESALQQLASSAYSGVAEQAAPACPADSRIGSATAAAGAGSRPLYVDGNVYLAGPYKGAPLSLVVVVPAVSGPYDLGNVVVRAAITVDRRTAAVTTVSDPLPSILDGIVLRTRFIRVMLDRPGFALNPTNCSPQSVEATVTGEEGTQAALSSPYQVANCGRLPYRPQLSIQMIGGVNRRGHPAIHATFRTGSGEANSKRVSVTLPKGQLLDSEHIQTVCTRVAFANESCPPGSKLGQAVARSPLLDQPLVGSVYLRSSSRLLPDLVVDLRGQVDVELVARVDSVNGRLRTTFEDIPDVPVGSVVLKLAGGSKGLLINSKGLCDTGRVTVRMTGQNGAVHNDRVKPKVACGSTEDTRRTRGSVDHRKAVR